MTGRLANRCSRACRRAWAIALLAAPAALSAQGTLSTQGYGYPVGQLSARARATGGALGELDPTSGLNPAALASWGDPALYFEYLPERRSVSAGADADRTLTSRFPLAAAALRVGSRVTLGLSASALLDRTWQIDHDTTVAVQGGELAFTQRFRSTGAINDIRLAAGWQPHRTLRLGLGGHVLSGENRVDVQFLGTADTAAAVADELAVQRITYSYSGRAASVGLEWRPTAALSLAASARAGGTLKTWSADTLLRRGSMPLRAGAAIGYGGLGGSMVAVRVAWDGWSSLADDGLTATAHDTWTVGVGAELRGPKWFGRDLPIRAGVHRRTLPFAARGSAQPRELGVTGGLGVPLARERARLDFVLEYDRRRADGAAASENGLLLGFGFTVRP